MNQILNSIINSNDAIALFRNCSILNEMLPHRNVFLDNKISMHGIQSYKENILHKCDRVVSAKMIVVLMI